MRKTVVVTVLCMLIGGVYALKGYSITALDESITSNEEIDEVDEVDAFEVNLVETKMLNDSVDLFYVNSFQLYKQEWDQLLHPNFWKKIMRLSADSCIVNIGQTRQIIEYKNVEEWKVLTDRQKDQYRDSVRKANDLSEDTKIYLTTGKADFYNYTDILSTVSKGVQQFEKQGVDPWYAQAILMIESPGQLAKSNAGAYGSFQLMPSVARSMGLKVNRYVDERKDFDKSAIAASRLLSEVCIPEAKKILDQRKIIYHENDLWFRLFVMHVYHAGAYNVAGVINKINPTEGGMPLIQKMWVTENGNFRNASQNYSQLAIAAMMILDDMFWDCDA